MEHRTHEILRPICLVSLTFFALLTRAAGDSLQRVRFREVDTLFANPGQGWMSQQRNPIGGTRFPCSVAYIRFDWTDVEPQEGQYNWKFIDGKRYGGCLLCRRAEARVEWQE